jgi:DNA repair protein RadC
MNAIATQATPVATPRKRGRPRKVAVPSVWENVPAREHVPHYLAGAGPASFKAGLPAHERAVIDAGLAILARYLGQPGAAFDGPQAVRDYLMMQFANEPRELFGVLWLDGQHRVICFEVASVGTLTQASVYPRELARAALGHNAAACILAHNHPSGSLTPSKADEALTRTLKTTLALVDVRVLDHFIVGGGGTASMAELGLM